MNRLLPHRAAAATAAIVMCFGLAACSSSDDSSSDSSASTPSSSATEEMDEAMGPFGAGCSAVPTEGEGSVDGMADDPVATAASNNPLLTTLVKAVTAADLGDTLNSAESLTVFAPTNDAFAKIPAADLNALLADKAALTKVLTHHVVEGELSPEDVAGEHKTLAGDTITVEGSGEEFTVGEASVICGNVDTANAKVYVVDSVLMP
ncbi:fasciclin domain-containing protein [Aeromicrobium sp. 636]|uniref:Fasciclin domain-containing protein n=1 Tax=Aeromicrobium senzhongii TaxID=2663859 RepID=A0A8I0ETY4_9ACTN|nr:MULTISPECIES: fasciclin domain-containing protein [Aeromicrobium]MBC9225062.1 fasciclin domain-containing protein [Aeromicrobium senzhongii]MCQ3997173.1 fasciclin domain-containing protein [Aeromicrobium sp. 636]MTB87112.1 fasciclin domain-containing protein [Aeromicrobium senzhongii]QNL93073.1 fasciclin domain-containing protein [Aeromicrobium senzhongii]